MNLLIILKMVILFFIIPTILGSLCIRFIREKNNIFLAMIVGYLLEFASFQLIYLPMYFLKCSFKMLEYVWMILILLLTIISLVMNRKNFKEMLITAINTCKSMPKLILVFCLLLAIQIYFPVRYMQHMDEDDAFYLAITNVTIETNSLFQYDAYYGSEYTQMPLRYCLSGLVIYFAVISQILNIHPAILTHTIWPAIGILLESMLYALLGSKLFKKDKEKLTYFLILLSIVYMFGFISIYTNFSFFAYRSWQGKALVANLIVPATWLFYSYCIENDKKVAYWMIFLLTMISACFVTEMGVFLIPIEVGVLSLVTLVQDRKILNFIKSIACCMPQIIIGLIYVIFQ